MKITIIGCDGAYPRVNGATSAYLIEDKKTKILLDCGSGSIARLQNHINLSELNGVIISHYHRDHYADLECMHFATMLDTFSEARKEPLVIYGPGEEEILAYKKFCIGKNFKKEEKFTIGSLTFSTHINKHGVEAYSIKVTNEEGKTIVYTGDTGYYNELPEFCKDANILVAEASCYEYERGRMSGHMTAIEAATVAKEGNVDTLVLTHLPHHGDIEDLLKEANTAFDKEILLAKYDLIIEV
ncbi:MBL fold metallo-hydrolase [Clostridium celatum]|uniref:Metallo-beta-lactamase domain protein n=1 Tax=Clostridium celatum DSM 1785 TaxID=545697 RepID=L1QCL1_9CLOT|nr:MBL fold metallo-hydrolase [Clostridium celatum]EKY25312.1 metallo-beta-lactamase domain protein [Clostridium celatum DSM 1785]MCE9656303.1 MBL fold metallo-hydrolase [Clostridium celatum]